MSLTRTLAHNTLWQIGGKVLSTVLGMITLGIMTRYLGTFGFGQYTIIMAVLQLAGILADMGLSLVLLQMIAEKPEEEERIVSNILGFRLMTAGVVFTLTLILSWFLPYPSIIRIGIAAASLGFFATSFVQVFTGLFQKHLATHLSAFAENIGRVVLLGAVLIVVSNQLGLLALLLAVSFGSVVTLACNYYFARRWNRFSFAFDAVYFRRIWGKSWPIGISIFFNLIYFKSDTLILSFFAGESDIGVYGAAYKVLEVVITVPFLFLGLMIPFFTQHFQKKNLPMLKQTIQQAFDAMALLGVPILFGSFALGTPIMQAVAGKEFVASGRPLQILGGAILAIFLSNVFTHVIIAIDKQKQMMWGFGATAAVSLAGYVYFIPRYSYLGAAWMTVAAESMILFTAFAVVYRATRFVPVLGKSMSAGVAACLMALSSHAVFTATQNLVLAFVVAVLVYALLLLIFGAVTPAFVREIIQIKKKN